MWCYYQYVPRVGIFGLITSLKQATSEITFSRLAFQGTLSCHENSFGLQWMAWWWNVGKKSAYPFGKEGGLHSWYVWDLGSFGSEWLQPSMISSERILGTYPFQIFIIPGMYVCWMTAVVVLRGTIVNRTCSIHKNLYIQLFLITIFGPINYGPP